MSNNNALMYTALLATIWDKEKKDTLELLSPFVICAIGTNYSIGDQVNISEISDILSTKFGFNMIPHSVLEKIILRLVKKRILIKRNKTIYLHEDLSELRSSTETRIYQARSQSEEVIESLRIFLNTKKHTFLKKDLTKEEVEKFFEDFLEANGYYIYTDVVNLRDTSSHESSINYHIAHFILLEYEGKTVLFTYIDNIVKGLLLSKIIYGYANTNLETNHIEKFKNTCIYVDTSLILHIFGFKSEDENTAAKQMVDILKDNHVPLKCFTHNYLEVLSIIKTYKNSIQNPSSRSGQTLEYFDALKYSTSDIERVLSTIDNYFIKHSIEIVDIPSLSGDGSSVITQDDYIASIGESELKQHLSKSLYYGSNEALDNDVASISSIFILRRGKTYKKIEDCKAVFLTSNRSLSYAVQKYNNTIPPLIINDLELTTLLWLKNHHKNSSLPTLKLIETARLSLEPTERIRTEFYKKIEQLKSEPHVDSESAARYSQLIYTAKEKVMGLIDGNPKNISKIELVELEEIAREYYSKALSDENRELKNTIQRTIDSTSKSLWTEADKKINNSGKIVTYILTPSFFLLYFIVAFIGVKSLIIQESEISIFLLVTLMLGILGIIDTIMPRLNKTKKLISILSNKCQEHIRKREQKRINAILSRIREDD